MNINESKTIDFDIDDIAETPVNEPITSDMSLSEMLDQYGVSDDYGTIDTRASEETINSKVESEVTPVQAEEVQAEVVHAEETPSETIESAPVVDVDYEVNEEEPKVEPEPVIYSHVYEKSEEPSYSYEANRANAQSEYNQGYAKADSSFGRKPKKNNYVTKKFLAVALIISVIASTALGATIGALVASKNISGGGGVGSPVNLEQATGSDMTIAQIIDTNDDSVVEINTTIQVMSMFGSTESQGAGSGVIIRDDGYIATNYHVIEGSKSVSVRLHNGDEYSAQIVGYDKNNDIAVLKINGKDFDAVDIGTSANLAVGDLAVAIGNPLGQLGGTATSGIISAQDRQLEIDGRTLTLLQTDSAINPGNSGGGLFDCHGNLVGIVVAKSSGTGIEGLGFAIPIDTAKPIIDDIIEHGKINTTPAAGIIIAEITEDRTEYYGVDSPGVYISEVTGVNAKKAGLEAGDRIVKFEGEPVESSSGLVKAIQDHKIGDNVEFIVERGGQQISIRTELEPSTNSN